MNVYVESNFVLELAFLREEHLSCSRLLTKAESGEINLIIPAFSIGEPYEALVRRSRRRSELRDRLVTELRELSRSEPYETVVREASSITELLVKSGEDEKNRLDSVIGQILDAARVIPIQAETIRSAIQIQETLSLAPQDSIIYASVRWHLTSSPSDLSCFLNRNSRDFLTPDIQAELGRHNCVLIPSFEDGVRFMESKLP